MAKTIDERVVSMAFENAKFEAGVAKTMASLSKLDVGLKKIGQTNSIGDIEKAANKVTLAGPASALDKLKAKLHFGKEAADGFGTIEKAGNQVTLAGPAGTLDKFGSKVAGVGAQAQESFGAVEKAGNQVTLDGAGSAIDGLAAKFGLVEVAAVAAFGTIVSKATLMGTSTAKGLTIGPVIKGYKEYELKLNSIQTILANTKASGATLQDVTGALNELNHYADQTIYNFGQMAKNIGTFTAAGVDLDTATASIKGIANLAALSGTNSEQASRAMYQLSQAISSGRVSLMDWKSVENAGMGGAVFQRNLAETAVAMGVLDKSAVKLKGKMKNVTVNGESFRTSIMAKPGEQSWLTSKVLTSSLKTFTGDMKDAELASMGFTKEQIKAIKAQAQTAVEAATKVKTFTQLMDTTKESIESGWAETWELVFGDFEEARKLWSGVAKTVGGFVQKTADARNKMLEGWDKLGGRGALIKGMKNAFQALFAIIKPISDAFRDIFPRKTSEDLYRMTVNFREFTKNLKPSPALVDVLRRVFRGLFAVLHIGWAIIKEVVGVIGDLLDVVGKGSGGFLDFSGTIGDLLVVLDGALVKGGLLAKFFDGVATVLKVPLQLFLGLSSAIFGLFDGADGSKADALKEGIDGVTRVVTPFEAAMARLQKVWHKLVDMFEDAKDLVKPWLSKIREEMSRIGDALGSAMDSGNFDHFMTVLQTTFIGGIFLVIKRALSGGLGQITGVLEPFKDVLGGVTNHLKVMQQNVKATMILKIAAAIAILAAGVWVMSTIDPKRLASSMTAVAVGLAQLMAAMKLMTSGTGKLAIIQIPVIATSMVAMATATLVLAGALKIFSTMSWDEIGRGLAGLAGSLLAIGAGMKLMGPALIVQGPGLIAVAIALNILALAMKQFASMKWEDLARGIAGVFGGLAAIAVPVMLMGPSLLAVGPGLIAVAVAMNILAGAIMLFGSMDPAKLGIGIGAMAVSLALIAAATLLIPPYLPITAAGMVILSIAMAGMAGAIAAFAAIGIGGLVTGLTAMAAALAILAAGVTFMVLALPGAAALVVITGALAVLAPTLAFLGNLSWGVIFKGLVAMGAALITLAVAGGIAAPGLAILGLALLPLAGAFLVSAHAAFIFAKALQLLGEGGTKGVAVMVAALTAFVALLPKIIIDFVKGLVGIVEAVAEIAPKAVDALVKIVGSLLAFIIKSAPVFAVAMGVLITQLAWVIVQHAPKFIGAAWALIQAFLLGIANNIGPLVAKGATIVVKFLEGLTSQLPQLISAGARFVVTLLSGIASKIPSLVASAARIVVRFLSALATKLPSVVAAGARLIANFLLGIANNIGKIFSAGSKLIGKLLDGVASVAQKVIEKGVEIAGKFIRGVSRGLVRLADVGAQAVIDFLNGMAKVVRERGPELRAAGWNLADAIVDGMLAGFKDLGHKVKKGIADVVGFLPKKAKEVLDSHSPSRVFRTIGQDTMLGLALGLERGGIDTEKSMYRAGDRLIQAAHESLAQIPTGIDGIVEFDPVISPVLDLTQVKQEAKNLPDMASTIPISADSSFGQATAISEEKAATDAALAEVAAAAVRPTVEFNQTNTSPEALSTSEIYRRTSNGLSKMKQELGLTPVAPVPA